MVEVRGFDLAQTSNHMIVWLGHGGDVATFVCEHVRAEIQQQTPDAVVEAVTLKSEPDLKTSARPTGEQGQAIVTGLQAAFPINVVVLRSDAVRWRLDVVLRYVLTSADANRELRQDFEVLSAVQV